MKLNMELKLMSKMFLFAFATLVLASGAQARECLVTDDGGYFNIQYVSGGEARFLTARELFEAMQEGLERVGTKKIPTSPLFRNIQQGQEDDSIHIMYYGANKEWHRPDIRSLPLADIDDPACKDKTITGFACREREFNNSEKAYHNPQGLKTPTAVYLDSSRPELAAKIAEHLGCTDATKLVYNARPAGEASASKAEPAESSASAESSAAPTAASRAAR